MAQMVLVSGTQLNPFIIMVLYMFGSYNFAEKSMPVPLGGDLNHALLLEVYGLWTYPRWSWPPEIT